MFQSKGQQTLPVKVIVGQGEKSKYYKSTYNTKTKQTYTNVFIDEIQNNRV